MPSPDKQIYYQLINTRLDELNQEDDLGHSSQAVVALDQQSVGRLSRMDALQAQANRPPKTIKSRFEQTYFFALPASIARHFFTLALCWLRVSAKI